MVSRTLLQLFTLSIIFTEKIETQRFNETNKSENPELETHTSRTQDTPRIHDTSRTQDTSRTHDTSYKRSADIIEENEHDTLLIRKTDLNQRSDTNPETKYDILAKCKYNYKSKHKENGETELKAEEECNPPVKNELAFFKNRNDISNEEKYREHPRYVNSNNRLQKTDVEEIKNYVDTKYKPNDESYLSNNELQDHQSVERQKHTLTVKRYYIKKSTTVIPKGNHRWTTEINGERPKTKNCDCTNHISVERISQESDIYRLKHKDEITIASKNSNEFKHRFSKRYKTFRKQLATEDTVSSKHNDNSKSLSKENEIYKLENRVDIPSVEIPVTKKVKPKHSHKIQKKETHEKVVKKVTDKNKRKSIKKQDYDKVTTKKHKPIHNSKKRKNTDLSKDERNVDSGDNKSSDEANTETSSDEKETQDSSEEKLKENDLSKQPILPFYITSKSLTKKEIAKKNQKKDILSKDAEITTNELNKVLTGNSDLGNIDINKVVDRLASSKVLDAITDKVADSMLKKLKNNHEFLRRFENAKEPEKIEKIDILFKNDGDMVMAQADDMT